MSTMLLRWREGFARDPQRGVADLISGRAALGGAVRLGVPEFLAREFGDADAGDPENLARRDQLDLALLGWLQQMVGDDTPAQVRRLGAPVYARRLCDALVAVQWLVLPKALGDLRARREWWHDRLHPWRLSSARDPGLELRRALTLEQQDQSLLSMWLRLADDPRDEYYAVALAGLQGMPEAGDGAAIQQHCLHAALRHAALKGDIDQARSVFIQEYAALRARYPRSPAQWESTLLVVKKSAEHGLLGRVGQQLQRSLVSDLNTGDAAAPNKRKRRQGAVSAPAGSVIKDALAADIEARRGTGESLAARLISLCEQNLSYARQCGDSFYFTRTLHNLGRKLFDRFELSTASLERLGTLIEESLIWEPFDPYQWMLLAQWFGVRGWLDQREWALREAIRLFPEDTPSSVECDSKEPARVELARLLISRGESHWAEAEQLLRAGVEISPRNHYSRIELARLLIRRGEPSWAEAEQLLRASISSNQRHELPRFLLAVLLFRRRPNDRTESRQLLELILKENPSNTPARQLMAQWFKVVSDPMSVAPNVAQGHEYRAAYLPTKHLAIEYQYGLADPTHQQAGNPLTSTGSALELFSDSDIATLSRSTSQNMWQTMQRLRGRGELQVAFLAALTAPGFTPDHTPVPERLTQAAERGDPLAGLYVQWLAPSTPLEPPPSAWAWRICRLWQSGSIESADWQQLLIEFPEHKAATLLLQSQVARQDAAVRQQMHRQRERLLQESPNALSAEQTLAKDLMSLDATVEPGQIFALLHCAAVPPPEFEAQIPQRLAA